MEKIWKVKDCDPMLQAQLSDDIGIHPIVAQLLINRGITDVDEGRQFLQANLSQLHDPFLMKGMSEAVDRINQAKEKKEKVLVYGDYDVDGVTSSALMNFILMRLEIDVIHHIPCRFEDGYGLNHAVAQYAKDEKVDLIITVDCGITAVEEIKAITDLGIDVVVIDHHEPGEDGLPNAVAIVNPKQPGCEYPFKELATVGLVAKLSQAVFGKLEQDFLDLAAVGTVADIVTLRDENRIFVKQGLPTLNQTKNLGLNALLESAKIKDKKITPYYIGFILGPRINASGRMDTALTALDLFLSESKTEAKKIASTLEQLNKDRQLMQKEVVEEAMAIVEEQFSEDEKVIVLQKEGWHKGVLGIVASRLTDKYYRPSVVISMKDGVGTASCRSIDGFHLHEALSDCSECLENFGGHEGAAGLTIREENVDPFREQINKVAERTMEIKKLQPILHVDTDIPIDSINLELAQIIDSMEPFGEGNPAPVFCSRNLMVNSNPAIMGRETIKFWVSDGNKSLSVIGFGMASFQEFVRPGKKIDIAYEITIDDWNKAPRPQLKLKDLKPA